MTFSQLQYLLEIHRTGSVSQAAKALFVTQSNVSIALNTLEKELGFPIFIRSKKGLTPTPRGMDIINHANFIYERYQLMTSKQQQQWTDVRIMSATVAPAQNAFIRLVRENKNRKDVRFTLKSGSVSLALDGLRFFNLDLAVFMALEPNYPGYKATFEKHGLELQLLGELPAALQLGQEHPLFTAENISIQDLEEDFLLEYPTKATSNGLSSAGFMQIKDERFLFTNHESIRNQLIQEGLAFSVSHMLPAEQSPANGIRSIPLEGLSYKLCIATNPNAPQLPQIDRYKALLQEELAAAGI